MLKLRVEGACYVEYCHTLEDAQEYVREHFGDNMVIYEFCSRPVLDHTVWNRKPFTDEALDEEGARYHYVVVQEAGEYDDV